MRAVQLFKLRWGNVQTLTVRRVSLLPLYYIPTNILRFHLHNCLQWLKAIRCIHERRPRILPLYYTYYKKYLYHAELLKWTYMKGATVLKQRHQKFCQEPLWSSLQVLKSRPLSEVLPPSEKQLALETIGLFELLGEMPRADLNLLAVSYLSLAKKYYHGFEPQARATARIEYFCVVDFSVGEGWYYVPRRLP